MQFAIQREILQGGELQTDRRFTTLRINTDYDDSVFESPRGSD